MMMTKRIASRETYRWHFTSSDILLGASLVSIAGVILLLMLHVKVD